MDAVSCDCELCTYIKNLTDDELDARLNVFLNEKSRRLGSTMTLLVCEEVEELPLPPQQRERAN
jgi:hypothetical protein